MYVALMVHDLGICMFFTFKAGFNEIQQHAGQTTSPWYQTCSRYCAFGLFQKLQPNRLRVKNMKTQTNRPKGASYPFVP